MALILDEIKDEVRLLVWHLTETEEDLKSYLQQKEILSDNSEISHPRRRLQKLAARCLLKELHPEATIKLFYDEKGKPHLDGIEGHISLSHSRSFVALAFSEQSPIGVDIEEPGKRILSIKNRFLHDEEKAWSAGLDQIFAAHLVWGVKECMFKAIGGGGILYKDQLRVHASFEGFGSSGYGNAQYIHETTLKNFAYTYFSLERFLLVFTIAY